MDREKIENPDEIVTSTVPIFFFIWDVRTKKIIYVSQKFYELAEDTKPLKCEKELKNYIHRSCKQQYEAFFESLSSKNFFTNKVELKTNDFLRDVKWIEIKTYPVEEDMEEVELVVGHIADITSKKERIADLEGENRNIGSMMQMISHDLRQPFTKIILLAEMIRMENEGNAEIDRFADKIKSACSSANELLESFLQLSVLNYKGQTLTTTNEELGSVIQEAINAFETEIEEKKFHLKIDIPGEEFTYPIDRPVFTQLIKNLISNSIKFTPREGSITIKLEESPQFYQISVSDNGIGIPTHIKSRLFKEVTAVRRTGLEGQISVGIGLAIANRIAALHNGTIQVESEEGKGSTFTIILPLEPASTLQRNRHAGHHPQIPKNKG